MNLHCPEAPDPSPVFADPTDPRVAWRSLAGLCLFLGLWLLGPESAGRELPTGQTEKAIRMSADYLVRHQDADGRFEYLVFLDGREAGARYNVLRHSGALCALAQHLERSRDPLTRTALLRGAQFLLRRHVREVPGQPGAYAVISLPGEEAAGSDGEIKLGGCALGLIALIESWRVEPGSVMPATLQGLGKFILAAQSKAGRFRSKFDVKGNPLAGFDSEYYPGEAILALARLHEVDPNPAWLEGARLGIAYLEQSRRGKPEDEWPADHWLMLATPAVFSQVPAGEVSSPPISRKRALEHVLAIGKAMMRTQATNAHLPGLRGSFVRNGAVTSTSTRVEGLIALYGMLPPEHPDRDRVKRSIEEGLGFVMRGQVSEGDARGGFTKTFSWAVPGKSKARGPSTDDLQELRIDYVQHALSALIGYESMVREVAVTASEAATEGVGK